MPRDAVGSNYPVKNMSETIISYSQNIKEYEVLLNLQ